MAIHYQMTGQGTQTIVLLHGWAMHSGVWQDFSRELAADYRVLSIDLPGHGCSDPIDQFAVEPICDLLASLIADVIGRDQAVCWLGWSLGGTLAIAMAERHPHWVSSLILLAANPKFTNDSVHSAAVDWSGMDSQLLADFADQLEIDPQSALMRFSSLQVYGLLQGKSLLKTLKASLSKCEIPDLLNLQAGLSLLRQADLRSNLAGLTVPVSVILGDQDVLVPVSVAEQMRQLRPDWDIHIIQGAGHVPFLSHTRQLVALVAHFLDQCN